MIKDIAVTRAVVAPSVSSPGQWSANLLFAVNNGDHLTLLDPKLPNLFKTVLNGDGGKQDNVLNAGELFSVSDILDSEYINQLDVCKFNKVVINSSFSKPKLHFGRISDPLIVKHQWTNASKVTKDCLLTVLLNTGELIVLERFDKYADQWKIKYNFFDIILRELAIEDSFEIMVDYPSFLKLKIKDFDILGTPENFALCILTENDEIKFYMNDVVVSSVSYPNVISITLKDNNVLAVVTSSNEVLIYNEGHFYPILPPTRFKLNKLVWYNDNLYIAYSNKLVLYDFSSGNTSSYKLLNLNVASITPTDTHVIITYEVGTFDLLNISTGQIEPFYKLNNWVSRLGVRLQLADEDKNGLYLHNYDLSLTDGTLSLVYRSYPMHDFNHRIKSTTNFQIAFTPLNSVLDVKVRNQVTTSTSLGSTVLLLFNYYTQFVVFPRHFKLSLDFIETYLKSFDVFWAVFGPIEEITLTGAVGENFQDYLVVNFTENEDVKRLQKLYNFHILCLDANENLALKIKQLGTELATSCLDAIEQHHKEITKRQEKIQYNLKEYLIRLVLSFKYTELSNIDKFILLNYYLYTGSSGELPFDEQSITITLSNEYVEEQFTVSRDQKFEQAIVSTSGHTWPRCELTLLPIIDITNNTDELGHFNYINELYEEGIMETLLVTLNYCIITGNKIYAA